MPLSRREPAGNVEAAGKGDRALEGNPAMGRAHAEDAAIASGQAHRSAAVAAQREVHQPARYRRGRAIRRATGYPAWGGRIDRRSIVAVLAGQAVGQLVGQCLADHARAGIEELLDSDRRLACRRMAAQPVGMPEAGPVAGNMKQILGAEREAGQGAVLGACQGHVVIAAKGAERIVRNRVLRTPDHAHGRRPQCR